LNVQDSGGSGYEKPANITDWFTALHVRFAGSKTQIWDDPDMFAPSGGPMDPSQLQADLRAVDGLVSGVSGFSFPTQMGPLDIGTSMFYDAYQKYYLGG